MTSRINSRIRTLARLVPIVATIGLTPASALLAADGAAPAAAASPAAPSGSVGFDVPESPAFTFLGSTPAKVSQPGTVRDIAIQLANAFDENGHVRQGFAVDVRVGRFRPIPLDRYKKFWDRLLYKTQISLGTVQASGDAGDTDIAGGIRFTLVDASDPMLDDAYVAQLAGVLNACKPKEPGSSADKDLACMAEQSKVVRDKWLADHWNAFRVSVALASGWRAVNSDPSDAKGTGWSAWAAGSVPLGRKGELIGQIRYTHHTADAAPTDARANDLEFGIRGFVGSGTVNGFLEVTGNRRRGTGAMMAVPKDSWSGGIECRVAEKAWISAGFGSSFGAGTQAKRIAVLAGLKVGFSDESKIVN
jgi:hypothetical protein